MLFRSLFLTIIFFPLVAIAAPGGIGSSLQKGLMGHWPLTTNSISMGTNLVENNDFEDGFTDGMANDWIFNNQGDGTGTLSEETSDVYSGKSAQKIEKTGGSYYGVRSQNFSVVSGVEYKISFWHKNTVTHSAGLYASCSGEGAQTIPAVTTWTRQIYTITPTSTGNCSLYLRATSNNSLLLDTVSIKPVQTADVSPHDNSGKIIGADIRNHGHKFDGKDDYGDFNSFSPPGGAVSFSVWFKTNEVGKKQNIIGKNRGYSTHGFGLEINSDRLRGLYSTANSEWYDNLNAPITPGEWHHAVLTFDNGNEYKEQKDVTGTLYLDGVKSASHKGTTAWYESYDFFIGAGHHSTYPNQEVFFDGNIADAQVFNRVLSEEEVTDLYEKKNIENGLVGFWPLSKGANDISGYGNHGTLSGAQKIGEAANFDGTGNFISIPNVISGDNTHTISFWINPLAFGDVWMDMGADNGYSFIQTTSSALYIGYSPTSSSSYRIYNHNFELNTWYHILITKTSSGNNLNVYVNGQLLTNYSGSVGDMNTGSTIFLGKFHTSSAYDINGKISNLRIYNRVLSATEIEQLYNQSPSTIITKKTSLERGLVGHWPMNEESGKGGSQTADITPYDNHGAINGATLTTGVNGESNTAMSFDGDALNYGVYNDYLNVPHSSVLDFKKEMTWSIWLKTAEMNDLEHGDIGHGIFYKKATPNYNQITPGYSVWQKLNGRYFMLTLGDGTNTEYKMWNYSTSLDSYDNEWFLLTISLAADGTVQFYFNDILKSTQQFTAVDVLNSLENSNDLIIGKGDHGTWDGEMSDMRIYNRILSIEEITQLYNKTGKKMGNKIPSLNSGLIGHWPLSGGYTNSSVFSDITPYDYHGTPTGTTSSTGINGETGGATNFNGNDYIKIPYGLGHNVGTNDLSLSMWIKANEITGSQIFAAFGTNIDNRRAYFAKYNNKWAMGIQGNSWDTNGNFSVTQNWTHISIVFDSDTNSVTMYINGVFHQSKYYTDYELLDNLTIGAYGSNTYPFDGDIADVRVYNRALSTDEVQRLYELR